MSKYFVNPFAISGDKVVIPEPVQPSGSVSYVTGFGPDYSLDKLIDPVNAKDVPRTSHNELFYEITLALQEYRQKGAPTFITTGDNLGVPYPYNYNAIVTYDDGINGIRLFRSLINSNTSLPTVSTDWQRIPFLITGTVGGTANALTLNTTKSYQTFLPGDCARLTILSNNTGASTLKIGIAAAISINKSTSSGLQDLDGDEMLQEGIYDFTYNGTVFVITNPSVDAATQIVTSWNGSISPVNVVADPGMDISSGVIRNKVLYSIVSPTTQSFSGGTFVVDCAIVADPYGWWNSGLKRFIPNVSGAFDFNICARILINSLSITNQSIDFYLYKNGSQQRRLAEFLYTASGQEITTGRNSGLVEVLPGDYFQFFITVPTGTNITVDGGGGELNGVFEARFIAKT